MGGGRGGGVAGGGQSPGGGGGVRSGLGRVLIVLRQTAKLRAPQRVDIEKQWETRQLLDFRIVISVRIFQLRSESKGPGKIIPCSQLN